MNAKKIMGAVLVALLAAALFVGAGAAATGTLTVFVNEIVDEDLSMVVFEGPNGGEYSPKQIPGAVGQCYFDVPGIYTTEYEDITLKINVIAPSLAIAGIANTDDAENAYLFIPGNLYQGADTANVTFINKTFIDVFTLYITTPDETLVITSAELDIDDKGNMTLDNLLAGQAKVGQYTIQAEFPANEFVPGTAPEQRITAPVTFSVVKPETAVSISAAETTVLKTEGIKLTVTGQPGAKYNVTFDDWAFNVTKQIGFNEFLNINGTAVSETEPQKTGIQFTMPAGGKATFTIKANLSAKAKVDSSEQIKVQGTMSKAKQASVVISFMKGTISAQAEKATYFVGDDVKVTGTTSAGSITYVALKGNNFYNDSIQDAFTVTPTGDDFEITFDTGAILGTDGKMLDVGTYTLSVGNGQGVNATVPIILKQPFINIISAPEVITQGEEDIEIIINAEAATKIGYYIFGNNYYTYGEVSTHVIDEDGETVENQFLIELDDVVKNMAAGQYFAVFQHPMNNEKLDVHGNLKGDGSLANWIIEVPTGQDINVDKRQTANAAQALCDALDAQGIDDMYVKATFFVVDKDNSYSISEIPTTVVQGETITISGVDTVNKGNAVVVEMLSSAFTAIPKEDENAAAFIVVTTTVADDGTWEVTLDTSALAVDEYNVAVKIADEIQKSATVNVVAAADEPETPVTPEQPEQPEQPEEPVAPATPGFGALAALAGLGAVAVLLLRRE